MKEMEIEQIKSLDLNDPILIEGLPGVGHIGKLAAEHLIDELDAEKLYEIYSPKLPPQVIVSKEGVAELVNLEVYAVKNDEEGRDILIVVGDHQSVENEGHYEITGQILDIAEEYGVKEIITLGGFATGEIVDEPDIYGAVNEESLVEELEDLGVKFEEGKPGGGIVGASGLLLGLGSRREIPASCLMGETSGYIVDPVGAQSILKILEQILNIEVDMQELEERADEMEDVVSKIRQKKQQAQQQQQQQQPQPTQDDLRYIG
ncbi:MAG: Archaeal enzyme of ATP-grasp superfamily [Candidatus Methanohalarchaeum thermophilum]|uniref:Archaeal enzyme of ATP-grasp superfamily n=1 Tax=Methanohalarchaeum thermophilum TaxID=1903181 RepID=A0A1Q6DW67_METT1|nr:MAG: Archaeal enzyme of ATP-grasp superfamily [Candidatus Methanohalarchaeum thermophilum]